MIEPSNEIAQRAAGRLAGLDAGLPAATERLLQGAPRRRSLDAGTSVALASLLVSLVQFGWTVYQDQMRQKEKAEARDSLVQRLRDRIETDSQLSPAARDLVADVVAEEILG
ncbi:MAG TPA: hypothetical protein VNM67_16355 [Thermoanaerobaculia bacterium]|jgi:hypothetical protein|nr:hypothetical protein [Thermoanaerobaculia bacterium]